MNHSRILQLLAVSVLAAPVVNADTASQWLKVFDAEDWPITSDEAELQALGWIFQDWDFVGYPQCADGTRDCTGVREVLEAPYGATGKVISIRGADPEEVDPANARSVSAFDLPASIPLGGTGTFYLKFAVDGTNISTHFGLTAETGPTNESAGVGPNHEYSHLATHSQVLLTTRTTIAVFDGFWADATLDPNLILEPEVWYELWYHITNAPTTDGGGYFELYIRGGAFGNEEPHHLANPYAGGGFTEWNFRQLIDQPLARFLNINNSGNPSVNPPRTDAMFFDDMYLLLDEFSLETPVDGGIGEEYTSIWSEVTAENGWKLTGIGWVYDAYYPWVAHGTAGWLYILPEGASLESFYAYGDEAGSWLWSADNFGGWYYNYGTSEWAWF